MITTRHSNIPIYAFSVTNRDFIRHASAGRYRMPGIYIFPEYILKKKDEHLLCKLINETLNNNIVYCLGYGKEQLNELIWLSGGKIWRRYKSVAFADECQHDNNKPLNNWIHRVDYIKILPLICYELYFPHYPAFFAKKIDVLIWIGTVQKAQMSWFKKLVKIRATDFGATVIGTTYPSKNKKIYKPLSFCVYPSHKEQDDIWFFGKELKLSYQPFTNSRISCSHGLKGAELFRKGLFGPFIGDLNENMFNKFRYP